MVIYCIHADVFGMAYGLGFRTLDLFNLGHMCEYVRENIWEFHQPKAMCTTPAGLCFGRRHLEGQAVGDPSGVSVVAHLIPTHKWMQASWALKPMNLWYTWYSALYINQFFSCFFCSPFPKTTWKSNSDPNWRDPLGASRG